MGFPSANRRVSSIYFSGKSLRIPLSVALQTPLSVINPETSLAGVTSNA
jgi:hypothetical protein